MRSELLETVLDHDASVTKRRKVLDACICIWGDAEIDLQYNRPSSELLWYVGWSVWDVSIGRWIGTRGIYLYLSTSRGQGACFC